MFQQIHTYFQVELTCGKRGNIAHRRCSNVTRALPLLVIRYHSTILYRTASTIRVGDSK